MRIESAPVYVYRTPVEGSEAPFEAYRDLAYAALAKLEIDIPDDGEVTLKPNATVLFPPEKRIITHPGFLAGLIEALVDKGLSPQRMRVADGNSGENEDHGHTWQVAGYTEALKERGVRLLDLNAVDTRPVAVAGGVVYETYPISTLVTDCSFLFNIPLAKCHNLGCTTLSIKNLMGVLTSPVRHLCATQVIDEPFAEELWRLTETGLSLFEDRFYHKLADLVTAVRSLDISRLTVIDGLIGRDGTAFNEGTNHPLGWTVIGENEVHVDPVGTYLMGLDPLQTPYLKVVAERGLGTNRIDDIEVVDLASEEILSAAALSEMQRSEPLMPISSGGTDGYYPRFRKDGAAVGY